MKTITESKIQRVKLRNVDPENGDIKISRRTKQCRITIVINKETKEVISEEYKILPCTIVSKEEILLDWVHGPTPTPKPSRKYSEEELKKLGYSDEIIKTIYRGYSSKDIDKVCKMFRKVMVREDGKKIIKLLPRNEAKALLEKYKFVSKIPLT